MTLTVHLQNIGLVRGVSVVILSTHQEGENHSSADWSLTLSDKDSFSLVIKTVFL